MTSIAVGAMAVMGGTFAYFSDSTQAKSKFTNGTIVLNPKEPYLENFNISGWKPGDKLIANNDNQEPAMVLNNQGTLPMNVFMKLDLEELNKTKNSIIVKELKFGDVDLLAKWGLSGEVTLAQLGAATQNQDTKVNGNTVSDVGQYIGYLNAQEDGKWDHIKSLKYTLEFKDTGAPQNELQGEITDLLFKFTGLQYDGITYDYQNLSNYSTEGGGTYYNTNNVNTRPGQTDPTPPPVPAPEITLSKAEITNQQWTKRTVNFFWTEWDVTATATFTFSDGSTLTDTKKLTDVNPNKDHNVKFSVEKDGKTYEKNLVVKKKN